MIKINMGGSEQPLPPQGMVKVKRSQFNLQKSHQLLKCLLMDLLIQAAIAEKFLPVLGLY